MKWMKILGKTNRPATTAKDRLQIIIAQQRSESSYPDYLPVLRQEIIALIAKHTQVNAEAVQVDLQSKENNAILELNITLPEPEKSKIS